MVHVVQNTQNWVITRCFPEDGLEMYQEFPTHVQSYKPFVHVWWRSLIAVVVVVCLSYLLLSKWGWQQNHGTGIFCRLINTLVHRCIFFTSERILNDNVFAIEQTKTTWLNKRYLLSNNFLSRETNFSRYFQYWPSLARVFPHFELATGVCFEFWLVHWIDFVLCDLPERLLFFCFVFLFFFSRHSIENRGFANLLIGSLYKN